MSGHQNSSTTCLCRGNGTVKHILNFATTTAVVRLLKRSFEPISSFCPGHTSAFYHFRTKRCDDCQIHSTQLKFFHGALYPSHIHQALHPLQNHTPPKHSFRHNPSSAGVGLINPSHLAQTQLAITAQNSFRHTHLGFVGNPIVSTPDRHAAQDDTLHNPQGHITHQHIICATTQHHSLNTNLPFTAQSTHTRSMPKGDILPSQPFN